MDNLACVVLAAGKGTRMESDTPKVLHNLAGKPIIFYILSTLQKVGLKKIYVVVSYQAGMVRQIISQNFRNIAFVDQINPLGTADAVKSTFNFFDTDIQSLLITNGDDSAFYKASTIKGFLESHKKSGARISVASLKGEDLYQMARVVRDGKGNFERIIEYNPVGENPKTGEINCGMYLFDVNYLKENVERIEISEKGEYFLTDLLNLARQQGEQVNLYPLKTKREWFSINSQEDLEKANKLK